MQLEISGQQCQEFSAERSALRDTLYVRGFSPRSCQVLAALFSCITPLIWSRRGSIHSGVHPEATVNTTCIIPVCLLSYYLFTYFFHPNCRFFLPFLVLFIGFQFNWIESTPSFFRCFVGINPERGTKTKLQCFLPGKHEYTEQHAGLCWDRCRGNLTLSGTTQWFLQRWQCCIWEANIWFRLYYDLDENIKMH